MLRPATLLIGTALVLLFAYHITFNLVPDDIRLQAAAGISLFLIAGSVGSLIARPDLWRIVALLPILVIGSNWIVAEAIGSGTLDLTISVRFVLPMLLAIWLLGFYRSLHPGLLGAVCAVTLIFALVWVVIHPQALVGQIPRFAPFTGDAEGAHASSYVVSICAIAIHQLMLNGQIGRRIGWSLLVLATLLLLGNRVATPIMMLLNYAMAHVLLTRRLHLLAKVAIFLIIVAGVATVLIAHESQQRAVHSNRDVAFERLGSGRIGTWIGRLELLAHRSPGTLLFGSGPGSDYFYSPIWLSEKKDAHNDFLTVTIESGLIGLVAVLFFYFLIFRRLGRDGYPLLIFFFSGSLLSNGLLNRPLIAALFWLVAALVAQRVAAKRQQAHARAQRTHARQAPKPPLPPRAKPVADTVAAPRIGGRGPTGRTS